MELIETFENLLKKEELAKIDANLSEAELLNLLNFNTNTYFDMDKKHTFFKTYINYSDKEKILFFENIKDDLKKIMLFVFIIVDYHSDSDFNENSNKIFPGIIYKSFDRIKIINKEAMKISGKFK